MGTPWDKDQGPQKVPTKHQAPGSAPDGNAYPFAQPEGPERDTTPTFRFQEQSIESVTGQFKAFQAAPTPTEPFTEPESGPSPDQNDPLYGFLVSQQAHHTPLPGHPGSRPPMSVETGPHPMHMQEIDMHTPPPGAPLPLRANQPAIEMNTRPSDSGPYRQVPSLQRPPAPLQKLQPKPPPQPISELYDPFFSSWGSEERLSPTNAADTRQLHAVPEEIYVPFLQEDLLEIEEGIVRDNSSSAPAPSHQPSVAPTPRSAQETRARVREDLSLPLSGPSSHLALQDEDNFASDWLSHDDLPAAQAAPETNDQSFAYIKTSTSLLNRFERVVLPTTGIEPPASHDGWHQANTPSGSGPGFPTNPTMPPVQYGVPSGQFPGGPYPPAYYQVPMHGMPIQPQMPYQPPFPPEYPMQQYPSGIHYPQPHPGRNPRQRGRLMQRRRSWWRRLMHWLVRLFTR